jgi:hypothetical protein
MEKRTKINIFTMQQNVENPSQLYLEL